MSFQISQFGVFIHEENRHGSLIFLNTVAGHCNVATSFVDVEVKRSTLSRYGGFAFHKINESVWGG